MRLQRRTLCVQLALAFGAGSVWAQEAPTAPVQRVEITGSSIKRIEGEGSLPVITLNRAAIEQTGATSVTELIQALPSMQGFTSSSDSINGGGGGATTASLRNLGEKYTLVLLNGRRVAPFDSGSTVNLEQLPLSAIERIEILADGASSLYGADAVAGVVNFITRSGGTDGRVDIGVSVPQHAGGRGTEFSISKGFGDLETDGVNVLAAFGYRKQDAIMASQRPFSKSGVVPFSYKGTDYMLFQTSINGNPPNIEITDAGYETLALYNPSIMANGNCGADPASFVRGSVCRFDYASTVQMQPSTQSTNLFLSGQVKLSQNWVGFGELLLGRTSMEGKYAPPAQPLSMEVGGALYNRYVAPYLTDLGVDPADIANVSYYMRVRDAGQRSDDTITKATHFVVGTEGTIGNFDTSFTYTHSQNRFATEFTGGYLSMNKMNELINSGAWDPFQQGTPESQAALAPAILSGPEGPGKSSLDVLSAHMSGPVFKMPAGDAYLGAGLDASRQGFALHPVPILMGPNVLQPDYSDYPVGANNGALPVDATRDVKGAFAELMMPLAKGWEVTAALRWDSYDAVKNDENFDADGSLLPPATQGKSYSAATYKLSTRFQPLPQLMLRGSVGTGFRAPSLTEITAPLADFGQTNSRECPLPANDPRLVGCRPGSYEYRIMSSGNPSSGDTGLSPEKSTQWSLGARIEPTPDLSIGLDLWSVRIKDVLTTVPEETAFTNFSLYQDLFVITPENGTGLPILTLLRSPINGAVAKSRGLDWDMMWRNKFEDFGQFTLQWRGTYLFESSVDYGFGGGSESSLGQFNNSRVAFRVQSVVTGTLKTGAFTNSLSWSYRPGYKDQSYSAGDATVFLRNPDGSRGAATDFPGLDVPATHLFDYQGRWDYDQSLSLTFGIRNLLDKDPPMSLKTVAGNIVGFDPRYADGVGRTFYLKASYKF